MKIQFVIQDLPMKVQLLMQDLHLTYPGQVIGQLLNGFVSHSTNSFSSSLFHLNSLVVLIGNFTDILHLSVTSTDFSCLFKICVFCMLLTFNEQLITWTKGSSINCSYLWFATLSAVLLTFTSLVKVLYKCAVMLRLNGILDDWCVFQKVLLVDDLSSRQVLWI